MNWHADHSEMKKKKKENIFSDPLTYWARLFESQLMLTQDQKLTEIFLYLEYKCFGLLEWFVYLEITPVQNCWTNNMN